MASERQQYSGDGGHQLHPVYQAFGETRLPARYLTTFSQGMTADGYFLDSWPAYDRLARISQRQMNWGDWGPINCVKKYWDNDQKVFIDNKPWMEEEKEVRYSDRALATVLLFHQCSGNAEKSHLRFLNPSLPAWEFPTLATKYGATEPWQRMVNWKP